MQESLHKVKAGDLREKKGNPQGRMRGKGERRNVINQIMEGLEGQLKRGVLNRFRGNVEPMEQV